MYSFQQHYKSLLSSYYTRIYGGREINYRKTMEVLTHFSIPTGNENTGKVAIDPGSGPGFLLFRWQKLDTKSMQ